MNVCFKVYGELKDCCFDTIVGAKATPLGANVFCKGCGTSLKAIWHKEEGDKETTVQTLIFSKDEFNRSEAIEWAKDHDFIVNKVDETNASYRIRQKNPSSFEDDSFRTITLTDGVKAVVGVLKKDTVEGDGSSEKGLERVELVTKAHSTQQEYYTGETNGHIHYYTCFAYYGKDGNLTSVLGWTAEPSGGPNHLHFISNTGETEPAKDGHVHYLAFPKTGG
jgi:hypothetical protein